MLGLWPRPNGLIAETKVWPFVVVIEQKHFHDMTKSLDGVDNEVIEAFGFEGLDEGLNVTVGFGVTGRDAFGLATMCER